LESVASRDVKVLVVANPANTNCLAALKLATHIPSQNFSCLTRLDHERLIAAIIEKVNHTHPGLNIKPTHVRNVCIFGNHSTTQVPLANAAEICVSTSGVPTWEPILKYINTEWLQNDLVSIVQQRGGAILKAQQASSGMSAAVAISRHLRDWLGAAPSTISEVFSMGILSDGNPYGIPPGLVFSFPCRRAPDSAPGTVQVDSSFIFDGKYSDFLSETVVELMGERSEAESLIGISLGGREP
jgi:malate dehydrogenase